MLSNYNIIHVKHVENVEIPFIFPTRLFLEVMSLEKKENTTFIRQVTTYNWTWKNKIIVAIDKSFLWNFRHSYYFFITSPEYKYLCKFIKFVNEVKSRLSGKAQKLT